MKKIPTIFERDWDGDRSRVLNQPTGGCEWVFAGEGIATRKLDGTCCLVRSGKLYKRHEVRVGKSVPEGFDAVETDPETGNVVGWVPVGDGPEDRWHREAFASTTSLPDGTYELVGPKVQSNREAFPTHALIPHTVTALALREPPERTYEALAAWFAENPVEGIVFHHPDGRMAKIKGKDLGVKRG